MWGHANWMRRLGVKHLIGGMGESIGEVRDEHQGKHLMVASARFFKRDICGNAMGRMDPGGCIWEGWRKQLREGASGGWEETFLLERIWKNKGTYRQPLWGNDLEKHLGSL